MNEKTLFKIAITCTVAGILLLLFISEKIDLSESDIAAINESMLDKDVRIKGYIVSIKETPGLYIIDVKDNTGEITVIAFKEDPINITKGQLTEIEGTITKYKNKIEINAKLIKVF